MNDSFNALVFAALLSVVFITSGNIADAQTISVKVTGEPETVVRKKDLKCRTSKGSDSLDLPASAFRKKSGEVLLIAGNRSNYLLRGSSLDTVRRTDCRTMLISTGNPDPSLFDDQEWVTALFSLDGKNVTGFVHNEYHEELHGNKNCRIVLNRNRECWYASTKLIRSSDGGSTFSDEGGSRNVLIGPARQYASGERRLGTFMPKVVGGRDGSSVFVFVSRSDVEGGVKIGQCLLRSTASKKHWEIWDDGGFRKFASSPYFPSNEKRRSDHCKTVIPGNILSVKYIKAFDRYIAVGGGPRGRVIIRHSSDLVNWSEPSSITGIDRDPAEDSNKLRRGEFPNRRWYFSLLDPNSPSRNFDIIGKKPYLYYIEFGDGKQRQSKIRKLMRVRVEIGFI